MTSEDIFCSISPVDWQEILVEDQLSSNCLFYASTLDFLDKFWRKTTVLCWELNNKIYYTFASLPIPKKSSKDTLEPTTIYINITGSKTWKDIKSKMRKCTCWKSNLTLTPEQHFKFVFPNISRKLTHLPRIQTSPYVWFMGSHI